MRERTPDLAAADIAREEAALTAARSRQREERDDRARYVRVGAPHFRIAERGEQYRCWPSEVLSPQIEAQGADHPLIGGGVGHGNEPQFLWAMIALDDRIADVARSAAYGSLPNGGGIVPSEFVLDEVGRRNEAAND